MNIPFYEPILNSRKIIKIHIVVSYILILYIIHTLTYGTPKTYIKFPLNLPQLKPIDLT